MRNLGTNNYSNNFEPQVNGVLDARTKIEGPASNLLLTDTWKSSDGNVWLPIGIRVSVVDDPDTTKNGVYMLLKKDYTKQENWLQLGANSSSDVYIVDPLKLDIGTIIDKYHREAENLSTTNQIEELLNIVNAYKEGRPIVYADETNMDATLRYGVLNVTASDDSYPVTITVFSSNGDLMALSIDSYNAGESWTVKILTNTILSINYYNLINPDRTSSITTGTTISAVLNEYIKRLNSGTECLVIFRGTNNGNTLIIPLTISISSSKLKGTISYILGDNTYHISISRTSVTNTFTADAPVPQISYLSTSTLLEERDSEIQLSADDVTVLYKLSRGNNGVTSTVMYKGVDSSGNQYLVPLSIYADFGVSEISVYDVTFTHPITKGVCHFSIYQKEDNTVWATKIDEQGVYVSKFTLNKFFTIANGDSVSTTDRLEMRRMWLMANRGYTVMLSGNSEQHTNNDYRGALGPVQISADGGEFGDPEYIVFSFMNGVSMYVIAVNKSASEYVWGINFYDISELSNKGRMMGIGIGSVNMNTKSVTYTLTPNTYFGTGQYLFEAEIGFNGDTIKLSEVLNIRSYEGGNMTTTAVGSTLTTSTPIVIGYSSSNILVGFPSNLNITSLTSSKAASLTKL
jgi:hypothetical protein